jgi:hypothetical protein
MTAAQHPASATNAVTPLSGPPQTCPFCDRTGLPILPLRYAVVRTDKGHAPDIVAPFNAGEIALPANTAKYTLRVLRPGYLYTFDEARGEWSAYVVNDQAYLYQFDFHANSPPQVPDKAFSEACKRKGDPYIARCITVKDAAHASNIWLGFSDVMWTQDVRDNHASESHRKKHMRCIRVADVRDQKTIPHVDKLGKLKLVAEFTRTLSSGTDKDREGRIGWNEMVPLNARVLKEVIVVNDLALGFSHQPLNQLGDEVQGLADWAARAAKPYQPLMAALDDPAGIATELALLMQQQLQMFMHDENKDKGRLRKTALSGAIEQLKDAVQTQAQQEHIDSTEKAAVRVETGYPTMSPMGGWVPGDAEFAKKLRVITLNKLQEVGKDAWEKYDGMYSEPSRVHWQNQFNTALQEFDEKILAPLALAHRDWMKSDPLANYFDCNFDVKVVDSGLVYTIVFGQCIAGTQDKKCSADLYTDWLQGSLTDKRNLLLRALCLNNDVLAKDVEEASKSAVTWAELSWDKLLDIGKSIFDQLLDPQKGEVGRVTSLVAGAITATLKKIGDSNRIYSGLVALGVMARSPFVPVTIEGSKKAFRSLLIRNMLKMNGAAKSISKNQLEKAVADELRRQEICGVDTKGTDKKTWLLMVDPDQVSKMPKGLSAEGQAKWLAGSIRTPEQVNELNLTRFRETVGQGSERVKGNMPFGFTVLGLLANAWAMQSILKDDEAALAQHKDEAQRRIYVQAIWVVGATADAIEAGLKRLAIGGVRFGQATFETSIVVFRFVGRVFGVVGGVLMAALDGWRAYQEGQAGHKGAALAYGVSAVLGIASTALLAIGWTGWGLIVVGLMFLWAFALAFLVNNKIQDWLELCFWGKTNNPGNRYQTMEFEMQQLEIATKG